MIKNTENQVVNAILHNKKPKIAEIEVTFFEYCTFRCSFCNHNKESKVGLSYNEIISKVEIFENFVNKLDTNVIELVQINMVGGELLLDSLISKGYLGYYDEFATKCKNIAEAKGFIFKTVIVSALLFTKIDKIKEMIENSIVDLSLIASWDIKGRIINTSWKNNLNSLSKYVSSINTVMTVDTLTEFMKMDKEYWEKEIYNKYNVFFDYYIPFEGASHIIPSDSLYLKFLLYCHKHYPDLNIIKDLLKKDENPMSCLSLNKLTIFPDGTTSNCRWNYHKENSFINKVNRDDNTNMMLDYITTYNCLGCEFYERCNFRCFTQWSWSNRIRDLSGCVIKSFLNQVL